MSVSFDGPNKLIIAQPGTTSIDVGADMYSRWKDWVLTSDNSKWETAFTTVGGDPTTGGNSIAAYFFLSNGWKLRPQEANHTLVIDGILLTDDQSSPYVTTIGTYNVSIQAVIPLQAESVLVETGVSGLTAAESVQLSEIEQVSYTGAQVFIDTVSGSVGNTFPKGTTADPVNNWSDASVIASGRGFSNYHLRGSLSLLISDTYANTTWMGIGAGSSQLTLAGGDSTGVSLHGINLDGGLAGRIFAEKCTLNNVTGFDGVAKECSLPSTVTIDATTTEIQSFDNCVSNVAGTSRPTLDVNGADCPVSVRAYSGGLTVTNFTAGNSMSIDVVSGTIEIAASCTSGTVVVRGIAKLVDNSGPGVTVNTDGLVEPMTLPATIATSVWDETI